MPDHWEALHDIEKILEPLAKATFKLKYCGIYGNTGSLWQWLTKLNSFLTFIEKQKIRLAADEYINKYVIIMVELIWEKLDYYYSLSDVTPVY